ncbi:MAG: VCBS repeat-containing protein [Bacteroidales bacterium]|nr:VCBS repeat-containing protein [Bacteroidales bacterium]
MKNQILFLSVFIMFLMLSCKKDSNNEVTHNTITPPTPSCNPASSGGSTNVGEPELIAELNDRWHEAWLASPVVADIDNDGTQEILAARGDLLLGWHLDNEIVFRAQTGGRIWSSPVVADLLPSSSGLEIAVSSRNKIYVWDKEGNNVPGFPVEWRDELRSLAAGDIDGDGEYELVAVTTDKLSANGQNDIIIAYNMDGTVVSGFPANTTGASGCNDCCYQTGGFDQNIALGDVNDDGVDDIFATQDNAYLSLHEGNGRAFDSNPVFERPIKFNGIRFFHDYSLSKIGWSSNEEVDNQAHFTNSAPAIADVNGDGVNELIVLASVQNASQTDRLRGVALWVLNNDGSRPATWEEPFHASDYLAGLWDYSGTNVVGATNQVAVADIDPDRAGPEFIFAGFDGRIHAVDAQKNEMWYYTYTSSSQVLTGGVTVVDLSSDGAPEIIFNSYSPDENQSYLFILDGGGNEKWKIPLPKRGAMPVPTIADVNGDGQLEIIVSLKDGEDQVRMIQVYTVAGSNINCLLWPTGRGNYLRNGYIPGL